MAEPRWRVLVPHRRLDDPLTSVASYCRHLSDVDDEAAITRQVALSACLAGFKAAADLADYLEAASPEERRRLLDEARADLGLPSTAQVEADELIRVPRGGLSQGFPVLDKELPEHLRGRGLGE
jgi:hypothetical protein